MRSLFQIPPLYPLTDTELSGLSHAEQVRRLAAGGATFIQLREKRMSGRSFYEEAKQALEVGREFGAKILINDRVDICLALQADGVHLGQDDIHPVEARRLLGDHALIGYSTHNVKQALESMVFPVDYLAVGPIFGTTSKSKPDPEVGIEGLRQVKAVVGDIPLVAIGGITPSLAQSVLQAGADSVAMISALLVPSDGLTQRTQQILQALTPA
ncbi:MAG TPA: thiamine phosphate synthase [Pyrinomonadaceae bacterium]|nr:thiamine phosphate synthase [Pyrinomonadaceae bacterium]